MIDYRQLKQQRHQKRISLLKKFKFYKMASFAAMAASLFMLLAMYVACYFQQQTIKENINEIAENAGFISGSDLDMFMKHNKNITKDDYARYVELKQQLEGSRHLQANAIVAGVAVGAVCYSCAIKAENKEKYYSNEEVEPTI